jgi:hypothetical protein
MPCGIKMEVVHRVHFLKVVNTTFHATTMSFSNDFSLENHNSHVYTLFFDFFVQNHFFLIANVKIISMTFARLTHAILHI